LVVNSTADRAITRCEECKRVQHAQESIVAWSCPACRFDAMPSSVARMTAGRCSRNCFECPYCSSNLQVVSSDGAESQTAWNCDLCGWSFSTAVQGQLGMAVAKLELEEGKVYDQIRIHLHNVIFPPSNPLLDKSRLSDRAHRVQLLIKKARLTANLKNSTGMMRQSVKTVNVHNIDETLEKLALEKQKSNEWPESTLLTKQTVLKTSHDERTTARNASYSTQLPLTTRLNHSSLPIGGTTLDLQFIPSRTKLRAKLQPICCGKPTQRCQLPIILHDATRDCIVIYNPTKDPLEIQLEWQAKTSPPITLSVFGCPDKPLALTTFGPWTLSLRHQQLHLSSNQPILDQAWKVKLPDVDLFCCLESSNLG